MVDFNFTLEDDRMVFIWSEMRPSMGSRLKLSAYLTFGFRVFTSGTYEMSTTSTGDIYESNELRIEIKDRNQWVVSERFVAPREGYPGYPAEEIPSSSCSWWKSAGITTGKSVDTFLARQEDPFPGTLLILVKVGTKVIYECYRPTNN